MSYIKNKFSEIKDNRVQGYVKHNLAEVLVVTMCAVLCGLDDLAGIVAFANKRAKLLKDKFGIQEIPSKPTFSRILSMVDGDEVAKVIIEIMKERTEFIRHIAGIIAVDGKTIRATKKQGKPNSALQIVTAYLTGTGVVLGQESIHEKTNEIPVFQKMLDYLNIKDKMITADAMHCQKETCKKIIKKGGNYIFGLKGNQKLLHKRVEDFFNDPSKFETVKIEEFTTSEKNGGRKEIRICRKVNNIGWAKCKQWAGLKVIFSVRRISTSKYKTTDETGYYICSKDISAEELLQATREHWKIESMHWLLDVVFSEDECKLLSENGQKTLNSLRKLALLVHRHFIKSLPKKCSIKTSLLNCLLDEDLLIQLIDNL